MLNVTKVVILRNADKNYDRLFDAIDNSSLFGKAATVEEKQTDLGYEITFKYLPQEALELISRKPKDYAMVS